MNYNVKVNLSLLKGAKVLKNKETKQRALIIPLGEGSHLFEGKQGVYLNLAAWEQRTNLYNESHYLKQSIGRTEYSELSPEEKRAMPIVGSMSEFVGDWQQQNTEIDNDEWEDNNGLNWRD